MKTLILIAILTQITACGTIGKYPKARMITAPVELAYNYYEGQKKPAWKTQDQVTHDYAKQWAAKNDPDGKLIKVGF